MAPREDWAAVMDRLLQGDRLALLKLSRLVNGFLGQWNAYDFRDDWDDVIQETILATARAVQEGRLRERDAMAGYLRSTARFVFYQRLKRHVRCREDETLPWEEVAGELGAEGSQDTRRDVQAALERLPDKRREAVMAVYVEGRSYDEAATATGIPLGSLKRYLREGLAQLRIELSALVEGG
jgi:RNA polymerase sigma-70 factor (ECF subfamily)